MTWEELSNILQKFKNQERLAGADCFFGIPERWYEASRWRCLNGHVRGMYIKSHKGDLCQACGAKMRITFPEDKDGPIDESLLD